MESWEKINAVQNMQNYIEEHVTESISLDVLARAAGYSPRHSARTHEGFTRAFSKHFAMTPQYYRKNTPPLKLFMPSRIRDLYLRLQKGEDNMSKKPTPDTIFVQVVERPASRTMTRNSRRQTANYGK